MSTTTRPAARGTIRQDGSCDRAWTDRNGAAGAYADCPSMDAVHAAIDAAGVVLDQLIDAGAAWNVCRVRERFLGLGLYAAIVAAHGAGIPETRIAEIAGCDRMTVRRALGKL